MKLSIILITANPTEKQFAWQEALACYADLADEVIVIDGGTERLTAPENVKIIVDPDPVVWNWAEHAKRLNQALAEASGDWIIKCDIDWLFHENDFSSIKTKLTALFAPLATFQKKTVYPFHKYVQKGEVPIAINSEYKQRIRFGKSIEKYTDLTYPVWWKGAMDEVEVPIGRLVSEEDWGRTGIDLWNFDYTFKTIDVAKAMFLRGSLAHKEYFGNTTWGNTEEEALERFLNNMRGKLSRGLDLDTAKLPKYIRGRYENVKPEEFGATGWGMVQ